MKRLVPSNLPLGGEPTEEEEESKYVHYFHVTWSQ